MVDIGAYEGIATLIGLIGGGLFGKQKLEQRKNGNGNGHKAMTTDEHERLCSSRIGSLISDVKEIKRDFKDYINSRQGQ